MLEYIEWEDCISGTTVAKNVSATFGADGGRPSRCAWFDKI